MDTLILSGICLASALLLNNKRDNFIDTGSENGNIDIAEYNEYSPGQYPLRNLQVRMNGVKDQPTIFTNNSTSNELPEPTNVASNSDPLLSINDRSIQDFANNNFVPNIRRDTQNMAGTGVANGNFKAEDYGINSSNILNRNYAGMSSSSDPTWSHKKAQAPMFSPIDGISMNVNGAPLIRPDLARFEEELTQRQHEKPFEPVRVGPGIGLIDSVPAEGALNAGLNNRILPNFTEVVNQLSIRPTGGRSHTVTQPTAKSKVTTGKRTYVAPPITGVGSTVERVGGIDQFGATTNSDRLVYSNKDMLKMGFK
jgi:hypothetical protein